MKNTLNQVLDKHKKKNLTLTGGFGYIGSALLSRFSSKADNINVVSRKHENPFDVSVFFSNDLTDEILWDRIVQDSDVVFHLAGNTSLKWAQENEKKSLDLAILPIKRFRDSCVRKNKYPRFIFASTVTVYGSNYKNVITEEEHPHPETIYDLHKLFSEEYLRYCSESIGFESIILRLSNVYGPSKIKAGSSDRGVLNKVTTNLIEGKKVSVYGDGNYLRDYIYIEDVVDAFLLAGDKPIKNITEVYNICSGSSIPLKKAFQTTQSLLKNSSSIQEVPWPENSYKIDKRNFEGDNRKFREDFNWSPKFNLEEGIVNMIKDFRGLEND